MKQRTIKYECPGCGWQGKYDELSQSLDIVEMLRCPDCWGSFEDMFEIEQTNDDYAHNLDTARKARYER